MNDAFLKRLISVQERRLLHQSQRHHILLMLGYASGRTDNF